MLTSSRILIGTIVAFVVVVIGFGAGMQVRKDRENPPRLETAAEEIPFNNNTYEISPPSNGVLLETYPVNIAPEGNLAYVRIPAREAVDIKTGQRVFMYDQRGELLDTLGEVLSVSLPDEDKLVLVQINLKNNPDIASDLIASGKIIIDRQKNVDRLPFSALLRNEKGKTHLWEVEVGTDGVYTAQRVPVEILGANDVLFSMETKHGHSNTFILNPDEKLRDDQKINVRKMYYRPPTQYEDQRIEAVVNQRLNNIAATSAAPPPPEGLISKCAQPPSITQDFINQVKALSGAAPAPPVVSP
jgi:hypothetical protein